MIFHQGDQGRNHHGQAVSYQSRELIAKAFTSTCWENGDGVAAVERGLHDLALKGTEITVSEDLFEQGL